jgi:hypothetical protein
MLGNLFIPKKNACQNTNIYLPFHPETSNSWQNPVNLGIYKKQLETYGMVCSYRLKKINCNNGTKSEVINNSCSSNEKNNDTYVLIANHKKSKEIPDGNFIYVIFPNQQGVTELRIGKGAHYILSDKKNVVLVAGDIRFNKGNLLSINDQSGSYYVNFKTDKEKKEYLNSVNTLLTKFDIPFNKFTPVQDSMVEIHQKMILGKSQLAAPTRFNIGR